MPKTTRGGKREKQQEPRRSLGTINGEEIRGYGIDVLFDGDESDYIDNPEEKDRLFKSLRDVYLKIQEAKEGDKKIAKDGLAPNKWSYEVSVETDTSRYSGYKIRRRKNRLYLQ